MTTDPFPKEAAVEVVTEFGTFRVGGMCKGSGMIEPRMATMLGYPPSGAAAVAPEWIAICESQTMQLVSCMLLLLQAL